MGKISTLEDDVITYKDSRSTWYLMKSVDDYRWSTHPEDEDCKYELVFKDKSSPKKEWDGKLPLKINIENLE